MPDIETGDRYQTAVYWPRVGVDRNNEPTRGDGVELLVRWETRKEEAVDSLGNRVMLDANVVLDREVVPGDFMALGELAYWNGTGVDETDVEVMEVITYRETPDIRASQIRRTAGLKRFRGSLPIGV